VPPPTARLNLWSFIVNATANPAQAIAETVPFDDEPSAQRAGQVYVWDRIVRLFHWALVAAFVIAYFPAAESEAVHVWAW
jgi:hypothetical protein